MIVEHQKKRGRSRHIAKLVVLGLVILGAWFVYRGVGIDCSGLWIGESRSMEGAHVAVAYRIERRGLFGDYYVTNDTYSLPSMEKHKPEIGAIIRDRWILLHCMAEAHGDLEGKVLTVTYSIIPLSLVLDSETPAKMQCSGTIFHESLILKKGTPAELEEIKGKIAQERKENLQSKYAGLTYSVTD